MIGLITQYALYALLFVTTALTCGGFYVLAHLRKGKPLETEIGLALSGLALIAAVAPYVGLFGTVWHIIVALGGIGDGNLNVAAIARPIGDALYTTLWGLGAAILALVAHRFMLALLPEENDHA